MIHFALFRPVKKMVCGMEVEFLTIFSVNECSYRIVRISVFPKYWGK